MVRDPFHTEAAGTTSSLSGMMLQTKGSVFLPHLIQGGIQHAFLSRRFPLVCGTMFNYRIKPRNALCLGEKLC